MKMQHRLIDPGFMAVLTGSGVAGFQFSSLAAFDAGFELSSWQKLLLLKMHAEDLNGSLKLGQSREEHWNMHK